MNTHYVNSFDPAVNKLNLIVDNIQYVVGTRPPNENEPHIMIPKDQPCPVPFYGAMLLWIRYGPVDDLGLVKMETFMAAVHSLNIGHVLNALFRDQHSPENCFYAIKM